ncbi:DUF2300 domain-containing protein [Massilia antarctica]|uniref:DUF2300 domain-containing protein n=1 Tax=Massilia antarctica TaxID=2765360 RepID=UPI0006BB6890|nr:DUF2300 domain-containing protein [Massilia sp. H27-R4]MCY0910773.1 DUF2300 domain-containing protein [Massilia sp. H27-R4]CUI08845.1 FIG00638358: hypothetical protein [Janthinobacterium sp. CG23_2]CUU32631.1 FIG00638358: hypothetical protein [Janthinobacterium sp. CG23_2]
MLPRPSSWLALALALAMSAPLVSAATLDVAWWRDGQLTTLQLDENGASRRAAFDGARQVPLGSLWKLFVYVYAIDTKVPTPDYTCGGQKNEEVYCCAAGKSIGRDLALAQSCGLFFSPTRLMLTRRPWQQYWSERLGRAPAGEYDWLADPSHLTPERLVSLRSLMVALAAIPVASRTEAESALLHVVLGARGVNTASWFGGRLRVKTYSWHHPQRTSERLGGAAGWLADGTPLWFGGADTSSRILEKWAPRLAATLPSAAPRADAGCVVVDYFARYPINSVAAGRSAATPGLLNGPYQVRFENGRSLAFFSQNDMVLARDAQGRIRLTGRFGVNEYVARVIDREGGTAAPEAAKALAVAARTYLQQNAQWAEGCQRIADSSATQRVSPQPASVEARAIANWTDQLVLSGVNVRYHADTPSKDTMAWSQAVAQAGQGLRFDAILASAYARADLTTLSGGDSQQCVRLAGAEAWLARELPQWERMLRKEAGYETPLEMPAVCQLARGTPYSEQSRNRIYVRGLASREDRITLAHEFLHLGLRNHPRGQDEALVEQLARRMVDARLEMQ